MSDLLRRISSLSPEKRALLQKRLRSGSAPEHSVGSEPIAIVGMGCRLPGGADSPEAFWKLLVNGVDAISDVGASRWKFGKRGGLSAEESYCRWAGSLDSVDSFDPAFFGIAPREAQCMDPQQRLLMEVAWEALEDAGQPLERLAGSATGVFVGIHNLSSDYYWMQVTDPEAIDTYTSTGGAHSIAANRLSYFLDLRGPSMAIDTACSSSLVAVHLACQSLRQSECDMALAGGVNLFLSPESTLTFAKLQFLAPDGRCKTCDASANGFVRGEGCGLVVLRRFSDALRDGDPVLAVILGTAVNQDGATNGLTAPNGLSQQAVVREALKNAGLDRHSITYIETHGTGTALGDPIEVEALKEIFEAERPKDRLCALGAVKTNIGHLETAAGIAGLLKAVLALRYRIVPPNLHFQRLNPHISLEGSPFFIPTTAWPWPDSGEGRCAGVSSFGFGGTNAHVVLQEAPKLPDSREQRDEEGWEPREARLLPLSARSAEALEAMGRVWREFLRQGDGEVSSLRDICYTAGVRRTHHDYRLAVVGRSREEFIEGLDAFVRGESRSGLSRGQRLDGGPEGPTFVCSGQGPQWFAMGRGLLEREPVYREMVERCAELLSRHTTDWALLAELRAEESESRLERTEIAQPAIFALQMGLVALWRSWGIEPGAVVGHSIGEVAASCVAGVLSLEQAVRVVFHRGRLLQRATGQGRMAAVELPLAEAERLVSGYQGRLSIAAVNSPTSVTLSGEEGPLREVVESLEERQVFCRMLKVNYAFHSPQVQPYQGELVEALQGLDPRPATIPIISTVTGKAASGADYGADYWAQNIRKPVQFARAIEDLVQRGHTTFLEIGPHPVLSVSISQCLTHHERTGVVLASLRRGKDEQVSMLESLGTLYTMGRQVRWQNLNLAHSRCVKLPSYPWQKRRYWLANAAEEARRARARSRRPSPTALTHPLLGGKLLSPLHIFQTEFTTASQTFLNDHRLDGAVVAPAAVFLEMAVAAAKEVFGKGTHRVEDLTIGEALVLPDPGALTVQLILTSQDAASFSFQIFSSESPEESGDGKWILHATGAMRRGLADEEDEGSRRESLPLEKLKERCRTHLPGREWYRKLGDASFQLGHAFQGISELRLGAEEVLAKIDIPVELRPEVARYAMHPVVLDACLQPLIALLPETDQRSDLFLLTGIASFRLYRIQETSLWSQATILSENPPSVDRLKARVTMVNDAGDLVAIAEDVLIKRVNREVLQLGRAEEIGKWFYDVTWERKTRSVGELEQTRSDPLPSAAEIADAVGRRLPESDFRYSVEDFKALRPHLENLSTVYMLQAVQRLGWDADTARPFSTDGLARQLGVAQQHRRLLARLLVTLHDEGILERTDSGWKLRKVPEPEDPQELLHKLRSAFPYGEAELALIGRCGEHLEAVLKGRRDPLEVLFPEGSPALLEKLYQSSCFARLGNLLVQEAVSAVVERFPRERTIRVLELGAGTGGTTSHVLSSLPSGRSQYVFTDVSNLFTAKAKEKFREYSFITYELLDLENSPASQGFTSHLFDLILAANVLHATSDIRRTLEHVKQLLASEGTIILLEVNGPQRWIDLIFGMTEGWWKFADHDLRPEHPLLDQHTWRSLLRETGFTGAEALPQETEASQIDQAVIVARGPVVEEEVKLSEPTAPAPRERRNWLIFADRQGVGLNLAHRLEERGDRVAFVSPGTSYQAGHDGHYTVDPVHEEEYRRLWQGFTREVGDGATGIVHLWNLDVTPFDQVALGTLGSDQTRSCGSVLNLLPSLASVSGPGKPRLWLVTRGAQAVGTSSEILSPSQALSWGLGRVVALEHPDIWGGLIDLETGSDIAAAGLHLYEEVTMADDEDQVAFREEGRYVARLAPRRDVEGRTPRFVADGTYLVTGGLGGLGLIVAEWAARQGAGQLVLTGRRGLPPRDRWANLPNDSDAARQVAAIRMMEARGTRVEAISADVSNPEQMAALFSRFGKSLPPLRGIFHCAAVIEPRLLSAIDIESLTATLRPKLLGTWVLHHLTKEVDIDFLILFSSTTSLLGSTQLGHYAAANQFLDTFAHYRRNLGLPALSVNWGVWERMRLFSPVEQEATKRFGLKAMPAEKALEALGAVLGEDVCQITIASVDWRTLKPAYEARRARPFLKRVSERLPSEKTQPPRKRNPIIERIRLAPRRDQRELLMSYIREEVGMVLGIDSLQHIDPRQGFFEMGMDSLTSVELRARLEADLGKSLPKTLTFNYPNVEALTEYVAVQVLSFDDYSTSPIVLQGEREESQEPRMDVEHCSEDELVAMLADKLKRTSEESET